VATGHAIRCDFKTFWHLPHTIKNYYICKQYYRMVMSVDKECLLCDAKFGLIIILMYLKYLKFGSRPNCFSHKKIQQDTTVYQNLFHIYMKLKCFGRHIAHHQEPKTALAASGFAFVDGCWPCSCCTLTAHTNHTSNNPSRMQNQRLLVVF
jgi:hypothetical protein